MLDRYDPLEDARSRAWEGQARDRSGRPSGDGRERVVDPRALFTRDLELPRGHERQRVSVRSRSYELRGSESLTLATVGAFRVVSTSDLLDHDGRHVDPRAGDLRQLREAALVQTIRIAGRRDHVVALTKEGRTLIEAHRRPGGEETRQAFYAGVKKPRELEHDVQAYRAYLRSAERLTAHGASFRRVVLDDELKREYQEFLQERNRHRRDSDGRSDRDTHEIAAWALDHALPSFDEHVHFPDVRIEYDDVDGRSRLEDIEVTTVHYRGAHASAVARSGVSRYHTGSVGVFGHGGRSRGGGGAAGPGLADEMLR